jgi:radical SAM superfamily enzyme YgiQ (UPF0313 family)
MKPIQKVLLINPPGKCLIRKVDGSIAERKHCQPPLGLAYLGAACLSRGYAVEILDILAEGYDQEQLTEHFIVYGLDNATVLERIRRAAPDLIGISILFSHLASECFALIREIRRDFPQVRIVLGGHHPSAMPAKVMANPDVDFVLIGESDTTFPMLLDALNGDGELGAIRGLWYRDGDAVVDSMARVKPALAGRDFKYYTRNDGPNPADVAGILYPAWQLLDLDRYWKTEVRMGGGNVMRERYLPMVGSRGCPHTCFFCTSPLMGGYKGYRKRTPEDICAEVRFLRERYGVQEIQFLDDNFFISVPRVKELLPALADQFPDLVFSVPSGTEANAIDEEVIEMLARAHFYRVLLALEAGDQGIQDAMIDKHVNLTRVPALVAKCKEVGLEVRGYFMMGFPGETREQILHTADFATSLDLDDFALSVVSPLPGTPLFDQCADQGLFTADFDVNNIRYSVSHIKLPDMGAEELENVRRNVWLEYKARKLAEGPPDPDAYKVFRSVEEFSNLGFRTAAKPDFP